MADVRRQTLHSATPRRSCVEKCKCEAGNWCKKTLPERFQTKKKLKKTKTMNKINYKYTIPITGYIYKVWSFLKKKKKKVK